MLKKIFKLIILVLLILIVSLLYYNPSSVIVEVSYYKIETTINNILAFISIIFVSFYLINKLKKLIFNKLILNTQVNLISPINQLDSHIYILFLKTKLSNIYLKRLSRICYLINNNKHDKAVDLIAKISNNKKIYPLMSYVSCLLYKKINDEQHLAKYCKIGMKSLHEKHYFYCYELLKLAVKYKNIDEFKYLRDNIKSKLINTKERKQLIATVNFYLGSLSIKTDEKKAIKLLEAAINYDPNFIEAYESLILHYYSQQKHNKVHGYLKSLWKHDNSYFTHTIWLKYANFKNYQEAEKIIKKLKTSTQESNQLLLASFAILFDKLIEARDLIKNCNQATKTCQFVMLELIKKERNFSKIDSYINMLLDHKNEYNLIKKIKNEIN